ncbi:MAG TPA: hypothetical protein VK104_00725 [Burkholderiaceae bacterium]|nr:hypothetical protein [Burkholderiaceae bacterium]
MTRNTASLPFNSNIRGLVLALGLVFTISACGDGGGDSQAKGETKGESSSATASKNIKGSSAKAKSALKDVDDEHALLVLSGAIDNAGSPTAQAPGQALSEGDHVYRPATATGKGEYLRRGSNAEGPYSFVIYTQTSHPTHPDEEVRTFVTVNLPENAQPGSYQLAAYKEAADDEAQARITGSGYGWTFGNEVDGTVDIVELGDELTAAWDFTVQDRRQREVEVSGAVKNLAFSPQVEFSYALDVNGEKTENRIRSGYGKRDDFLTLFGGQPPIYLEVLLDAEPGTYQIGRRKDGDVSVRIPKLSYDDLSGEVTITENGSDYRDFNFEFTTTGENTIEGSGDFRYVPAELLQSE